jgi:hypothetical protein
MANIACDHESETGHAEAYKNVTHEDAVETKKFCKG